MKFRAIIIIILFSLIWVACSDNGVENPYSSSPPPVITIGLVDSVYPIDGAVGVNGLREAKIYFSEATDDTTISSADFSISGSPGYVVRRYGQVVHLDFFTGLNHGEVYTITVGTNISDTLGNQMTSKYNWSFTTEFGPGVESHYPLSGDTGVLVDAVIEVRFDRDMDPATINDSTFVVGGGIPGEITYSNRTAYFDPDNELAHDRLYDVTLFRWATDTAGNRFDNDYSWRFRTVDYIDSLAPYVIDFQPSDGATDVPLNSSITVTFSELIDTATVNQSTFYLDDTTSGSYTFNGNSVTFKPDNPLKMNQSYTATVTEGITDTPGISLESSISWSFTTEEIIPPVLMPLAVGNKWVYEVIQTDSSYNSTTSERTIHLIRSEVHDGKVWYYDTGYGAYTVNDGILTIFELNMFYRYYDATDPEGDFDIVDVAVPAGTFTTYAYSRSSYYAFGGTDTRYFADGVGMVYRNDTYYLHRGEFRLQYRLISYELVK